MRDLYEENGRMNLESLEDQIGSLCELHEDDALDRMQENPLGHLLKLLAKLPEIREDKVFHARQRICRQDFEIEEHLDLALDRVLEELITE